MPIDLSLLLEFEGSLPTKTGRRWLAKGKARESYICMKIGMSLQAIQERVSHNKRALSVRVRVSRESSREPLKLSRSGEKNQMIPINFFL